MKSLPPPDPPFAELGFYADDRPDVDLFHGVLDALEGLGGRANGRAFVLPPGTVSDVFAGPSDQALVEVRLDRLAELRQGLASRVVAAEVAGVLPHDAGHCVRVTYLRIDVGRSRVDRHPVAIWASGEELSGPVQRRADKVGRELRRLFAEVVDWVRPSYGALTVEWGLRPPVEIASDPKAGWDYRDFFLGEPYVGSDALDGVAQAAEGLAVDRSPAGLFVFSTPAFGGTGLDHQMAGAAFAGAIARRSTSGSAPTP